MKTMILLAASLLSCGFVFAQNNENLYAKATDLDKAISNIDNASSDVMKKLYLANYEETNSYDQTKFIRIYKRKTADIWSVDEFYMEGFLKMRGVFTNLQNETKEGEFITYYPYNILESQGNYKNNLMDGEWKFYSPNGSLVATEFYEDGTRTKAEYLDEKGDVLHDIQSIENRTSFIGGRKKLFEYLGEQLVEIQGLYPKKLPSKVITSFTVNIDGTIQDAKIEQGIEQKLDSEILKILTNMPKWQPAKKHNRPVREQVTLPIVLALED